VDNTKVIKVLIKVRLKYTFYFLKVFIEFNIKLFLRLYFRNLGKIIILYKALLVKGITENLLEIIIIGLLI
jgi:hypothetical protein